MSGVDTHRPLADLGDALVLLQEVEFVMRHVPIKQHDRTPEEQTAVEAFTTYWCWVRDVLRQARWKDSEQIDSLVSYVDLAHAACAVDATTSAEDAGIDSEGFGEWMEGLCVSPASDVSPELAAGIDTDSREFRLGVICGVSWGVQAERHRAQRSRS